MENGQLDVVVIGNIINETIRFPDKTIGPVLGSPAAYSSIAMSAVGANVGLISYYGDDTKELLERNLFRVDRRGWIFGEKSTTNYLNYREDGSKYVEYEYKAPAIEAKDIPSDYMRCGCYYICPMDYEVDIEVNKKLFEAGKTVVVDMGGYGGATSSSHYTVFEEKGDSIVSQVTKYSTIIKASYEDLTHIAPHTELDDICAYFFSRGTKICVVTMGAKGSYYRTAGEKGVYVQGYKVDNPVDFTGAGDSFGAGFMACLSKEFDIHNAVIFGNALASLVIEKTGGCVWERMPPLEKVTERIEKNIRKE